MQMHSHSPLAQATFRPDRRSFSYHILQNKPQYSLLSAVHVVETK
jgi:hypothetical protein